jgi:hypothetical protein
MQTMPKRSWRHRLGEVASSAIFDFKLSSTFPDEACEHCSAMAKIRNVHFCLSIRPCSTSVIVRVFCGSDLVLEILNADSGAPNSDGFENLAR